MRLALIALPLALMCLAGCVDVDEQPPVHHQTTVVTPAPGAPGGTATTVVNHP